MAYEEFKEPEKPQQSDKSWIATWALCYFLGGLGAHRFYTGYIGIGITQLLTFGGFGLWVLIDLICLYVGIFKDKDGKPLARYSGKTAAILFITLMILGSFISMTIVLPAINKAQTAAFEAMVAANKQVIQPQADLYSIQSQAQHPTRPARTVPPTQTKQKSAIPQEFPMQTYQLKVTKDYLCKTKTGKKMVCGTIVNESQVSVRNVFVDVKLYDANQNLITTTQAQKNYIPSGGSWNFRAPIEADNVKGYIIMDPQAR